MMVPMVLDYAVKAEAKSVFIAISVDGMCTVTECSPQRFRRLAVESFIELVGEHAGDELVVYSSICEIGALVKAYPALFGTVHMCSTVGGVLAADFEAARAACRKAIEPPERACVVVATDASMRDRSHRAGISLVSSNGLVKARATSVKNIHDAELWAIDYALDAWVGETKQLHILTDSRYAYQDLSSPTLAGHLSDTTRLPLRRCAWNLYRAYGHTDVHIHWVRGHNGHPLNELADEVAMFTRRNDNWGLNETQTTMLERARAACAQLVDGSAAEDFVPAVSGPDAWVSVTCAA